MTNTVGNLNTAIFLITAEYPSLPSGAGEAIAREITAFQSMYFSRFHTERCKVSAPVSVAGEIALSVFNNINGRYLRPDDILEVHCDGATLPILPYGEYLKSTCSCCAFLEGKMYLHFIGTPGAELVIVYRYWHTPVTYENSVYVGSVCVLHEHLPLLFYKVRQTVCALAGEFEEADYWARAYNAGLEALSSGGEASDQGNPAAKAPAEKRRTL